MKKLYSLAVVLTSVLSFSQVSLTATGVAYTENFDGMAATTTLPANWNAVRAAGTGTIGQALTLIVSNGSSNTGGVHNIGLTPTDRSLGMLASNATVAAVGVSLVNNTGSAITQLSVSYVGRQWRTSDNSAVNEVVSFGYSLNATSLTTGTWSPVTALDFNEILTSSTTAAQVDGTLPANSVNKSAVITGLNIPNGATFWIRFADDNLTGTDGLYAIDNFSLTPTTGALAVSDIKNLKAGNFVKNTFVKSDEITFGADVKDVKVYNMFGQVVKSASVKENGSVNVAGLAKGNYIVTGTVNNEPVSQKILKD
ncbi:T9SS type A sorting domain-containing protein [Chryseobacterium shigense]|uniref:Por secretion system C-terminal sorting domain-containing protein n=1 Tax=Chryseobacterium shigense TaxID=297244 RepID=A0A841N675_9FLAO|nr:T9SS type A sorting domain-containing protein [Chryseobacterium shigense]MBB6372027.1 hypothetical protein [Chryseobacterium shigense]